MLYTQDDEYEAIVNEIVALNMGGMIFYLFIYKKKKYIPSCITILCL